MVGTCGGDNSLKLDSRTYCTGLYGGASIKKSHTTVFEIIDGRKATIEQSDWPKNNWSTLYVNKLFSLTGLITNLVNRQD